MKFTRQEIPMAYSMIDAASRVRPRRDGRHPIDRYFLLWTAFNNIYSSIADRQGYRTQLIVGENGTVATCSNGNVNIPKVKTVSGKEQLHLALSEFDEDLKHSLISHQSTKFFKERIPFWQGKKIERDAFGQRLNGVIHVKHTTCMEYPVWSPVDVQIYERFLENPDNPEERDFLTRQIVELLYTVQRNMMHLGVTFDDSTDIAVFENALALLEMILAAFIQ